MSATISCAILLASLLAGLIGIGWLLLRNRLIGASSHAETAADRRSVASDAAATLIRAQPIGRR